MHIIKQVAVHTEEVNSFGMASMISRQAMGAMTITTSD
jgi:hypothetical protein